IYVSINQGLGAGVIVGDRLQTRSRGYAGEVGHMVLQFNGPRCSCGRRGCAEALIATRAIQRGNGSSARLGSLEEVRAHLTKQDPETLKAVTSAGHHLGMLLVNLAAAYDPGSIVLGGSVIELGDSFLRPALAALEANAAAGGSSVPSVRTCRFGANAVAIGAAALVRHRLTRPTLSTQNIGTAVSSVQEVH
ncbi:MAG: ROK family protein, partial [Rubrivivax sp.]